MKLQNDRDERLSHLAQELETAIDQDRLAPIWQAGNLPARESIAHLLDNLLSVLFPGVFGDRSLERRKVGSFLRETLHSLSGALEDTLALVLRQEALLAGPHPSLPIPEDLHEKAQHLSISFLQKLPALREILWKDIEAAYQGDPAAPSFLEVLLSYPCVEAVAIHRMAHELYLARVPLLPRMMNEVAHSRTGIDIHPGARIGEGFFIDHGTGVVIGETTTIGRNVKIYQGVTLGALSFPKDARGNPIKGSKRHPDIEDDVTIYAGATVLGGRTVLGRGSVIGGNCWVTESVAPYSLVLSEHSTRRQVKEAA